MSDNVKWRIRHNFEDGQSSNFRMLGYRLVDGQITVVPEEMETVQRIFDLYLQGNGSKILYSNIDDSVRLYTYDLETKTIEPLYTNDDSIGKKVNYGNYFQEGTNPEV